MLDLASPLDGFGSPFGVRRGFSPRSFFAAGEQGAWYDPSDFSTMFQDNLGATPVTAVDQSVGLIRDKSGRSNHASQSNASFKPLLKQDGNGKYYLLFDGTDDFLATSAIDFTGTNKMSVFAGARKLSDAARAVLVELGTSSESGTFNIEAPFGASSTYGFYSRGTVQVRLSSTANYASPITNVLTLLGDISAPAVTLRVNGVQDATSASSQGTGNYGNLVVYMGRRAGSSMPFSGGLYSLVIRGAATSALELTNIETYVNRKTGAF